MSTYPQDLSTEKRRTSGLSTRKNDSIRASSFPPRKSPSPDFLAYTHTNVNKKTKQKTKQKNKTKQKQKGKTTKQRQIIKTENKTKKMIMSKKIIK